MKNPKKETRDVIAKHVRWTEALRVVRAYHPEVTIILPQEKIQIYLLIESDFLVKIQEKCANAFLRTRKYWHFVS